MRSLGKELLNFATQAGRDWGTDLGDETRKPLTDLELARRIAFILTNAGKELNPVEKPANPEPVDGDGAKTP
jgi:hypothetical protein